MKKTIAKLLSLVMVLSACSGCAGQRPYEPTGDGLADYSRPSHSVPHVTAPGELHESEGGFTLAYNPDAGFNPYTCLNIHNRMLFSLLYQSLFTVSDTYTVEPQLCASFTVTEDLMTYTFTLAEATFADGSVLSANDVVASLNRARESDYYKGRFRHFDTIEAADSRTVTITTEYPMDNLMILLDIPVVRDGETENQRPSGTGPYILKSGDAGLSLQLREDWWCSADLPISERSIALVRGESPTQIRDEFEFGSLGISTADPGSASYAAYRSDHELWDAESGLFLYLGCNLKGNVVSNSQVRVALSYAIDRAAILAECYNGFGAATVLPASPHSPVYDKTLAKQVTYDPSVLVQALTDSEHAGKTIRLLVRKDDPFRLKAARKISKMLTDCGLEVELLAHSYNDYRAVLRDGSYDLYLGQTRLSPNMDLSEFFRPKGTLTYGGFASETNYTMCLEALENIGNFYNLHQMILRNGQMIPILFRSYAVYAQRGIADDMQPSRDNIFYYSMGTELSQVQTIVPAPTESDE